MMRKGAITTKPSITSLGHRHPSQLPSTSWTCSMDCSKRTNLGSEDGKNWKISVWMDNEEDEKGVRDGRVRIGICRSGYYDYYSLLLTYWTWAEGSWAVNKATYFLLLILDNNLPIKVSIGEKQANVIGRREKQRKGYKSDRWIDEWMIRYLTISSNTLSHSLSNGGEIVIGRVAIKEDNYYVHLVIVE